MNLEENNDLGGVPMKVLQNLFDWILLPDEELAHACLDFLYQYTAVVDNVEYLLRNFDLEPLTNQLTRLLAHGAKTIDQEVACEPSVRKPAPQEIATLPQELLGQLVRLEEPERSSRWLRCLFEEDQHEWITQIALWQGYQNQFNAAVQASGMTLLVAADFIKNVSTTFADKATAQVQQGATTRFIIRGIRRREVPVDFNGEEFRKCSWVHAGSTTPCNRFFTSPQSMYQHILKDHVGAQQTEDGKFENTSMNIYTCNWERCHRFKSRPATKLSELATHIKVHLTPAASSLRDSADGPPPSKRSKPSYVIPGAKKHWQVQTIQVDERNEASGLPLTAALVLRNLARNIPKTDSDDLVIKAGGPSKAQTLFKPLEPRLWDILAHNKALVGSTLSTYMLHFADIIQQASNMTDLLHAINEA
jgi:chromatin structure-remodeling complex subunit RSC9